MIKSAVFWDTLTAPPAATGTADSGRGVKGTPTERLELVGDEPIPGLIAHAAGACDAGTRCIDVWESKEQFERFFAKRLVPALATLDIPGGPPVSFEELDVPVILRGRASQASGGR